MIYTGITVKAAFTSRYADTRFSVASSITTIATIFGAKVAIEADGAV